MKKRYAKRIVFACIIMLIVSFSCIKYIEDCREKENLKSMEDVRAEVYQSISFELSVGTIFAELYENILDYDNGKTQHTTEKWLENIESLKQKKMSLRNQII